MKKYLGDSVYVEFNGFGLNLTTENGFGPTNSIYLEPGVYGALTKFVEQLRTPQMEKGKTMFRLMNSAMMPAPGNYRLREVDVTEFAQAVNRAQAAGALESYVGYPQTADLIARLSGVPILVSREQTPVFDGDVLLICRLRYRVADPKTKGEPVAEDFQYFICEYSA